jgi:hypothetical protein
MSSPQPQLLASCWTSAGDVMPARGPDHSPLPIRTRIEAVAAAGYVGFGLTRQDLVRARDSIGLGTLATMLRDNGIRYVQLEWLTDWWTSGAARAASDRVRADLFEAAPILGVDHIKVGADDDGVPVGYEVLCEGSTCSPTTPSRPGCGSPRGTPFTHVKTTEDAVAFVTEVGKPNGGLLLIFGTHTAVARRMPRSRRSCRRNCLRRGTRRRARRGGRHRSRRHLRQPTSLRAGFSMCRLLSTRCWRSAGMAVGYRAHVRDFRRRRCSTPSRARDAVLHCFDLAAQRHEDPTRG